MGRRREAWLADVRLGGLWRQVSGPGAATVEGACKALVGSRIRIGTKRPDLAAIDAPDTEDAAANEDQAKKLERKIDRTIGGPRPFTGPPRILASPGVLQGFWKVQWHRTSQVHFRRSGHLRQETRRRLVLVPPIQGRLARLHERRPLHRRTIKPKSLRYPKTPVHLTSATHSSQSVAQIATL